MIFILIEFKSSLISRYTLSQPQPFKNFVLWRVSQEGWAAFDELALLTSHQHVITTYHLRTMIIPPHSVVRGGAVNYIFKKVLRVAICAHQPNCNNVMIINIIVCSGRFAYINLNMNVTPKIPFIQPISKFWICLHL